jgi:hypothetical protein
MPWKERYTISDERTLLDSDVRWPNAKRCCFRVVVDLAPASGPEGIKPQATRCAACATRATRSRPTVSSTKT